MELDKMKKNLISLFLISSFTIVSCDELVFEENLSSKNPRDNFMYLWTECDEKYSYFDVKNIDWNNVRSEYATKLYDGMSDDSLFNVLGGMLSELKDDHTNLISHFNISSYGVQYTSQDNFDWRILVDNYIGQDFYMSGPFSHNFLDNGQIGYVRLPAFTGTIDNKNLNFILNRYKDTKGLILDLRENGGGAVSDVFRLLNRFTDDEITVFYSRIKNGPAHDDFTELESAKLEPYEGIRYTKKIIFLIDRGTYSAASFTSLATKAMPNIFTYW